MGMQSRQQGEAQATAAAADAVSHREAGLRVALENAAAAVAAATAEAAQRYVSAAADAAEAAAAATSAILNEDPSAGISSMDPRR